jgi:hypothetical protein
LTQNLSSVSHSQSHSTFVRQMTIWVYKLGRLGSKVSKTTLTLPGIQDGSTETGLQPGVNKLPARFVSFVSITTQLNVIFCFKYSSNPCFFTLIKSFNGLYKTKTIDDQRVRHKLKIKCVYGLSGVKWTERAWLSM